MEKNEDMPMLNDDTAEAALEMACSIVEKASEAEGPVAFMAGTIVAATTMTFLVRWLNSGGYFDEATEVDSLLTAVLDGADLLLQD